MTPKRIVYRYNGDATLELMFHDHSGESPPHTIGEIVHLDEKPWRVVGVDDKSRVEGLDIPIHRVFLTDRF